MSDHLKAIAELRDELDAVKKALGTSLVMLQATHHLAMSLAATRSGTATAADVFDSFASRGGDHLLNSLTSESDLEQLEKLNAVISKYLRSTA